ncbi:hypothetical protein M422DRAFT_44417 [Sphaerobolus stellatus SS14]|nr:hypothetical protein M422DRAFT_44417 [Sphaerobolus stellatus SS14]
MTIFLCNQFYLVLGFIVILKSTTRSSSAADTGIWVAADIEAWFLGYRHVPADINMALYRRRMCMHLLSLAEVAWITPPDPEDDMEAPSMQIAHQLSSEWHIYHYSKNYNDELGDWRNKRYFILPPPIPVAQQPIIV